MRFSKPYGADTPLADRLQMPGPPTRPRDRSRTPMNTGRRPSIYGFIRNATTPFPTSSPNRPPRGASPIIPSVPASNAGGRESSPIIPPNSHMPDFPADNSPRTADPGPHPNPATSSNSAHLSSEPNGCGSTPPHGPPASGGEPSNPPSSSSSNPNSSTQNESSSFNAGTNNTGSLDFGAFASEVRSHFKTIRGEIQHIYTLTPQPTKTKARKHGAFTTKTPPRPRTAVRTEMMVSER